MFIFQLQISLLREIKKLIKKKLADVNDAGSCARLVTADSPTTARASDLMKENHALY